MKAKKYDSKSTLPEYLRPLMELESVKTECCAICGRRFPLNDHHIVRRGAGRLFKDGKEVQKPTVTLCGFGNTLKGPDGYYCHGLAHSHKLHFKNIDGRLAYRFFDTWTPASKAIQTESGWRFLNED